MKEKGVLIKSKVSTSATRYRKFAMRKGLEGHHRSYLGCIILKMSVRLLNENSEKAVGYTQV